MVIKTVPIKVEGGTSSRHQRRGARVTHARSDASFFLRSRVYEKIIRDIKLRKSSRSSSRSCYNVIYYWCLRLREVLEDIQCFL